MAHRFPLLLLASCLLWSCGNEAGEIPSDTALSQSPTPSAQALQQAEVLRQAREATEVSGFELVRRDTLRTTSPVTGAPSVELKETYRHPETGEERYLTQRFAGEEVPALPDPVYNEVDEKPRFPSAECLAQGGEQTCHQRAMLGYLQDEVRYPEAAGAAGLQGTLLVAFVVEKDGAVTGVKLIDRLSPVLNEEAVRVVSSMPPFLPGVKDGRVVRTQMVVPVTFRG